jgi:hypothetical protein
MGGWFKWLTVFMIIIFSAESMAWAQENVPEIKRCQVGSSCCVVYKTQEEIAWDVVMYAIKNIPNMTFRIKHYEDLLETYRKALNVIKEPKEPVLPAPE